MNKIGYIRVSTEKQETARQQEIMCGYQVDRIFSEKISGANKDRPQLKAMLDYVREGDTLYIESISRLGRSTKDLLNIIDTLNEKGVNLISHKEKLTQKCLQENLCSPCLPPYLSLKENSSNSDSVKQAASEERAWLIAYAEQRASRSLKRRASIREESLSRLIGINLAGFMGNGSQRTSQGVILSEK